MAKLERIIPNLWFDTKAEKAAEYYISIFKNSGIDRISYYTEAGKEIHKKKPGSAMTIEFHLEGQHFVALNGGPNFKFNEAVSFIVNCETQKEIDYFWEKLKEGGDPKAQQCGWLKDKFGLSWQVAPTILADMLVHKDKQKAESAMAAMMEMKKLDIDKLKAAFRSS